MEGWNGEKYTVAIDSCQTSQHIQMSQYIRLLNTSNLPPSHSIPAPPPLSLSLRQFEALQIGQ